MTTIATIYNNAPKIARESILQGGGDDLVFEARGISKRFGGVSALDAVDLELRRGEVLAIVGDNGAGKSTLIKAVTGALRPDSGTIRFDGREVQIRTPAGPM